jgi:hypothetical protein
MRGGLRVKLSKAALAANNHLKIRVKAGNRPLKQGQSRRVPDSVCFAKPRRSNGVALELGHEVVAGADAESHDRKRGILAGI